MTTINSYAAFSGTESPVSPLLPSAREIWTGKISSHRLTIVSPICIDLSRMQSTQASYGGPGLSSDPVRPGAQVCLLNAEPQVSPIEAHSRFAFSPTQAFSGPGSPYPRSPTPSYYSANTLVASTDFLPKPRDSWSRRCSTSTMSSGSVLRSSFSSVYPTYKASHSGYTDSSASADAPITQVTPLSSIGSPVPVDLTTFDPNSPSTGLNLADGDGMSRNSTGYSSGTFQSRNSPSGPMQTCSRGMLDPPSRDSIFGDLVKPTSANSRQSGGRWTRGVSRAKKGGKSLFSRMTTKFGTFSVFSRDGTNG
jgi:hypothetical protein